MNNALIDNGEGQAMIRVDARSAGPGLIVHRHRRCPNEWALSHLGTGYALVEWIAWMKQSQAIAAGKAFAKAIDCTRTDLVEAAREAELTDGDVQTILRNTAGAFDIRC